MSVIWHKVWFDLWHHKARTFMAVFSIAAGVFAIGSIFGLVEQLEGGMNEAHQAVAPSHLNIILRQPIDRDMARGVAELPGVREVELLNIMTTQYRRTVGDEWQPATVVMRDDYENQLYDWMILKEGSWPVGRVAAVERLTSEAEGLAIGDTIILDMPGTDREIQLGGKIRHPFIAPPEFGGAPTFFMDSEGMARLGLPEGSFLQLLVQIEPYSEDYAQEQAVAIKDELAKQDIGVFAVIYQEPEEHWAQDLLSGMTLVLRILAVVSLFTSVVLVVNTMTAVITQQTDQIGIIKAVGGGMGLLMRIYLAGVAVYGLIALVIALPLGMVVAFAGTAWMLDFFNIDYEVFRWSNRAILFQVLAALAAPLLAAIWPVWKGAGMSVREAMATYGLGGDFGFSRLDRAVERLGEKFLSSPYAIALGNMFRRKGRLLLTQVVLTTAGTMFLMVMTLSASLTNTLENELARRQYDIRLNFTRPYRAERVVALANQMPGVVNAETWYSVTGTVMKEGERVQDTGGLGAELFGIDAASDVYRPLITSGRWLEAGETGNVAVISKEMADFNDLVVGDVITVDLGELGAADWTVVGFYKAIVSDPFTTDPIYAPAEAVVAATKKAERASLVLIKAEDERRAYTASLSSALRALYEERQISINVFTSRTKMEDREYAYNQFSILLVMLMGLAGVMGIVGGVGLMGSLSISVVERTREIGVLRAIGAQSPAIMGMFMMEGVLQGVFSWVLTVPLAFVVARPVAVAMGEILILTELDFAFNYGAVALWFVIVVVIAIVASVFPAYSATKISVRESLAYA
ncbi:MAG TPA: FtsX-like permease family protein [Anaerolineae bacterium]|nr:FtsX-like permease family protein [Anaerolineae bacterium]